MDELKALESMGFILPSPSYLFGAILFGILGYAAYRHGKKISNQSTKWLGIALMLYPYAVSETWLIYAIGASLCIGIYAALR